MEDEDEPIIVKHPIFNSMRHEALRLAPLGRKVALAFDVYEFGEVADAVVKAPDTEAPKYVLVIDVRFMFYNMHQFLGNVTYFKKTKKEAVANTIKAFIDDLFLMHFEVIVSLSSGKDEIIRLLDALPLIRTLDGTIEYRVGKCGNIIHIFDPNWLYRELGAQFRKYDITFADEHGLRIASFSHMCDLDIDTASNNMTTSIEKFFSSEVSYQVQQDLIRRQCFNQMIATPGFLTFFRQLRNSLKSSFGRIADDDVSGACDVQKNYWDYCVNLLETMSFIIPREQNCSVKEITGGGSAGEEGDGIVEDQVIQNSPAKDHPTSKNLQKSTTTKTYILCKNTSPANLNADNGSDETCDENCNRGFDKTQICCPEETRKFSSDVTQRFSPEENQNFSETSLDKNQRFFPEENQKLLETPLEMNQRFTLEENQTFTLEENQTFLETYPDKNQRSTPEDPQSFSAEVNADLAIDTEIRKLAKSVGAKLASMELEDPLLFAEEKESRESKSRKILKPNSRYNSRMGRNLKGKRSCSKNVNSSEFEAKFDGKPSFFKFEAFENGRHTSNPSRCKDPSVTKILARETPLFKFKAGPGELIGRKVLDGKTKSFKYDDFKNSTGTQVAEIRKSLKRDAIKISDQHEQSQSQSNNRKKLKLFDPEENLETEINSEQTALQTDSEKYEFLIKIVTQPEKSESKKYEISVELLDSPKISKGLQKDLPFQQEAQKYQMRRSESTGEIFAGQESSQNPNVQNVGGDPKNNLEEKLVDDGRSLDDIFKKPDYSVNLDAATYSVGQDILREVHHLVESLRSNIQTSDVQNASKGKSKMCKVANQKFAFSYPNVTSNADENQKLKCIEDSSVMNSVEDSSHVQKPTVKKNNFENDAETSIKHKNQSKNVQKSNVKDTKTTVEEILSVVQNPNNVEPSGPENDVINSETISKVIEQSKSENLKSSNNENLVKDSETRKAPNKSKVAQLKSEVKDPIDEASDAVQSHKPRRRKKTSKVSSTETSDTIVDKSKNIKNVDQRPKDGKDKCKSPNASNSLGVFEATASNGNKAQSADDEENRTLEKQTTEVGQAHKLIAQEDDGSKLQSNFQTHSETSQDSAFRNKKLPTKIPEDDNVANTKSNFKIISGRDDYDISEARSAGDGSFQLKTKEGNNDDGISEVKKYNDEKSSMNFPQGGNGLESKNNQISEPEGKMSRTEKNTSEEMPEVCKTRITDDLAECIRSEKIDGKTLAKLKVSNRSSFGNANRSPDPKPANMEDANVSKKRTNSQSTKDSKNALNEEEISKQRTSLESTSTATGFNVVSKQRKKFDSFSEVTKSASLEEREFSKQKTKSTKGPSEIAKSAIFDSKIMMDQNSTRPSHSEPYSSLQHRKAESLLTKELIKKPISIQNMKKVIKIFQSDAKKSMDESMQEKCEALEEIMEYINLKSKLASKRDDTVKFKGKILKIQKSSDAFDGSLKSEKVNVSSPGHGILKPLKSEKASGDKLESKETGSISRPSKEGRVFEKTFKLQKPRSVENITGSDSKNETGPNLQKSKEERFSRLSKEADKIFEILERNSKSTPGGAGKITEKDLEFRNGGGKKKEKLSRPSKKGRALEGSLKSQDVNISRAKPENSKSKTGSEFDSGRTPKPNDADVILERSKLDPTKISDSERTSQSNIDECSMLSKILKPQNDANEILELSKLDFTKDSERTSESLNNTNECSMPSKTFKPQNDANAILELSKLDFTKDSERMPESQNNTNEYSMPSKSFKPQNDAKEILELSKLDFTKDSERTPESQNNTNECSVPSKTFKPQNDANEILELSKLDFTKDSERTPKSQNNTNDCSMPSKTFEPLNDANEILEMSKLDFTKDSERMPKSQNNINECSRPSKTFKPQNDANAILEMSKLDFTKDSERKPESLNNTNECSMPSKTFRPQNDANEILKMSKLDFTKDSERTPKSQNNTNECSRPSKTFKPLNDAKEILEMSKLDFTKDSERMPKSQNNINECSRPSKTFKPQNDANAILELSKLDFTNDSKRTSESLNNRNVCSVPSKTFRPQNDANEILELSKLDFTKDSERTPEFLNNANNCSMPSNTNECSRPQNDAKEIPGLSKLDFTKISNSGRNLEPQDNTNESLKPQNNTNESLKPRDNTNESLKPRDNTNESLKPRDNTIESLKPQINTNESLKSKNNTNVSLKPQNKSNESLQPSKIKKSKKKRSKLDDSTRQIPEQTTISEIRSEGAESGCLKLSKSDHFASKESLKETDIGSEDVPESPLTQLKIPIPSDVDGMLETSKPDSIEKEKSFVKNILERNQTFSNTVGDPVVKIEKENSIGAKKSQKMRLKPAKVETAEVQISEDTSETDSIPITEVILKFSKANSEEDSVPPKSKTKCSPRSKEQNPPKNIPKPAGPEATENSEVIVFLSQAGKRPELYSVKNGKRVDIRILPACLLHILTIQGHENYNSPAIEDSMMDLLLTSFMPLAQRSVAGARGMVVKCETDDQPTDVDDAKLPETFARCRKALSEAAGGPTDTGAVVDVSVHNEKLSTVKVLIDPQIFSDMARQFKFVIIEKSSILTAPETETDRPVEEEEDVVHRSKHRRSKKSKSKYHSKSKNKKGKKGHHFHSKQNRSEFDDEVMMRERAQRDNLEMAKGLMGTLQEEMDRFNESRLSNRLKVIEDEVTNLSKRGVDKYSEQTAFDGTNRSESGDDHLKQTTGNDGFEEKILESPNEILQNEFEGEDLEEGGDNLKETDSQSLGNDGFEGKILEGTLESPNEALQSNFEGEDLEEGHALPTPEGELHEKISREEVASAREGISNLQALDEGEGDVGNKGFEGRRIHPSLQIVAIDRKAEFTYPDYITEGEKMDFETIDITNVNILRQEKGAPSSDQSTATHAASAEPVHVKTVKVNLVITEKESDAVPDINEVRDYVANFQKVNESKFSTTMKPQAEGNLVRTDVSKSRTKSIKKDRVKKKTPRFQTVDVDVQSTKKEDLLKPQTDVINDAEMIENNATQIEDAAGQNNKESETQHDGADVQEDTKNHITFDICDGENVEFTRDELQCLGFGDVDVEIILQADRLLKTFSAQRNNSSGENLKFNKSMKDDIKEKIELVKAITSESEASHDDVSLKVSKNCRAKDHSKSKKQNAEDSEDATTKSKDISAKSKYSGDPTFKSKDSEPKKDSEGPTDTSKHSLAESKCPAVKTKDSVVESTNPLPESKDFEEFKNSLMESKDDTVENKDSVVESKQSEDSATDSKDSTIASTSIDSMIKSKDPTIDSKISSSNYTRQKRGKKSKKHNKRKNGNRIARHVAIPYTIVEEPSTKDPEEPEASISSDVDKGSSTNQKSSGTEAENLKKEDFALASPSKITKLKENTVSREDLKREVCSIRVTLLKQLEQLIKDNIIDGTCPEFVENATSLSQNQDELSPKRASEKLKAGDSASHKKLEKMKKVDTTTEVDTLNQEDSITSSAKVKNDITTLSTPVKKEDVKKLKTTESSLIKLDKPNTSGVAVEHLKLEESTTLRSPAKSSREDAVVTTSLLAKPNKLDTSVKSTTTFSPAKSDTSNEENTELKNTTTSSPAKSDKSIEKNMELKNTTTSSPAKSDKSSEENTELKNTIVSPPLKSKKLKASGGTAFRKEDGSKSKKVKSTIPSSPLKSDKLDTSAASKKEVITTIPSLKSSVASLPAKPNKLKKLKKTHTLSSQGSSKELNPNDLKTSKEEQKIHGNIHVSPTSKETSPKLKSSTTTSEKLKSSKSVQNVNIEDCLFSPSREKLAILKEKRDAMLSNAQLENIVAAGEIKESSELQRSSSSNAECPTAASSNPLVLICVKKPSPRNKTKKNKKSTNAAKKGKNTNATSSLEETFNKELSLINAASEEAEYVKLLYKGNVEETPAVARTDLDNQTTSSKTITDLQSSPIGRSKDEKKVDAQCSKGKNNNIASSSSKEAGDKELALIAAASAATKLLKLLDKDKVAPALSSFEETVDDEMSSMNASSLTNEFVRLSTHQPCQKEANISSLNVEPIPSSSSNQRRNNDEVILQCLDANSDEEKEFNCQESSATNLEDKAASSTVKAITPLETTIADGKSFRNQRRKNRKVNSKSTKVLDERDNEENLDKEHSLTNKLSRGEVTVSLLSNVKAVTYEKVIRGRKKKNDEVIDGREGNVPLLVSFQESADSRNPATNASIGFTRKLDTNATIGFEKTADEENPEKNSLSSTSSKTPSLEKNTLSSISQKELSSKTEALESSKTPSIIKEKITSSTTVFWPRSQEETTPLNADAATFLKTARELQSSLTKKRKKNKTTESTDTIDDYKEADGKKRSLIDASSSLTANEKAVASKERILPLPSGRRNIKKITSQHRDVIAAEETITQETSFSIVQEEIIDNKDSMIQASSSSRREDTISASNIEIVTTAFSSSQNQRRKENNAKSTMAIDNKEKDGTRQKIEQSSIKSTIECREEETSRQKIEHSSIKSTIECREEETSKAETVVSKEETPLLLLPTKKRKKKTKFTPLYLDKKENKATASKPSEETMDNQNSSIGATPITQEEISSINPEETISTSSVNQKVMFSVSPSIKCEETIEENKVSYLLNQDGAKSSSTSTDAFDTKENSFTGEETLDRKHFSSSETEAMSPSLNAEAVHFKEATPRLPLPCGRRKKRTKFRPLYLDVLESIENSATNSKSLVDQNSTIDDSQETNKNLQESLNNQKPMFSTVVTRIVPSSQRRNMNKEGSYMMEDEENAISLENTSNKKLTKIQQLDGADHDEEASAMKGRTGKKKQKSSLPKIDERNKKYEYSSKKGKSKENASNQTFASTSSSSVAVVSASILYEDEEDFPSRKGAKPKEDHRNATSLGFASTSSEVVVSASILYEESEMSNQGFTVTDVSENEDVVKKGYGFGGSEETYNPNDSSEETYYQRYESNGINQTNYAEAERVKTYSSDVLPSKKRRKKRRSGSPSEIDNKPVIVSASILYEDSETELTNEIEDIPSSSNKKIMKNRAEVVIKKSNACKGSSPVPKIREDLTENTTFEDGKTKNRMVTASSSCGVGTDEDIANIIYPRVKPKTRAEVAVQTGEVVVVKKQRAEVGVQTCDDFMEETTNTVEAPSELGIYDRNIFPDLQIANKIKTKDVLYRTSISSPSRLHEDRRTKVGVFGGEKEIPIARKEEIMTKGVKTGEEDTIINAATVNDKDTIKKINSNGNDALKKGINNIASDNGNDKVSKNNSIDLKSFSAENGGGDAMKKCIGKGRNAKECIGNNYGSSLRDNDKNDSTRESLDNDSRSTLKENDEESTIGNDERFSKESGKRDTIGNDEKSSHCQEDTMKKGIDNDRRSSSLTESCKADTAKKSLNGDGRKIGTTKKGSELNNAKEDSLKKRIDGSSSEDLTKKGISFDERSSTPREELGEQDTMKEAPNRSGENNSKKNKKKGVTSTNKSSQGKTDKKELSKKGVGNSGRPSHGGESGIEDTVKHIDRRTPEIGNGVNDIVKKTIGSDGRLCPGRKKGKEDKMKKVEGNVCGKGKEPLTKPTNTTGVASSKDETNGSPARETVNIAPTSHPDIEDSNREECLYGEPSKSVNEDMMKKTTALPVLRSKEEIILKKDTSSRATKNISDAGFKEEIRKNNNISVDKPMNIISIVSHAETEDLKKEESPDTDVIKTDEDDRVEESGKLFGDGLSSYVKTICKREETPSGTNSVQVLNQKTTSKNKSKSKKMKKGVRPGAHSEEKSSTKSDEKVHTSVGSSFVGTKIMLDVMKSIKYDGGSSPKKIKEYKAKKDSDGGRKTKDENILKQGSKEDAEIPKHEDLVKKGPKEDVENPKHLVKKGFEDEAQRVKEVIKKFYDGLPSIMKTKTNEKSGDGRKIMDDAMSKNYKEDARTTKNEDLKISSGVPLMSKIILGADIEDERTTETKDTGFPSTEDEDVITSVVKEETASATKITKIEGKTILDGGIRDEKTTEAEHTKVYARFPSKTMSILDTDFKVRITKDEDNKIDKITTVGNMVEKDTSRVKKSKKVYKATIISAGSSLVTKSKKDSTKSEKAVIAKTETNICAEPSFATETTIEDIVRTDSNICAEPSFATKTTIEDAMKTDVNILHVGETNSEDIIKIDSSVTKVTDITVDGRSQSIEENAPVSETNIEATVKIDSSVTNVEDHDITKSDGRLRCVEENMAEAIATNAVCLSPLGEAQVSLCGPRKKRGVGLSSLIEMVSIREDAIKGNNSVKTSEREQKITKKDKKKKKGKGSKSKVTTSKIITEKKGAMETHEKIGDVKSDESAQRCKQVKKIVGRAILFLEEEKSKGKNSGNFADGCRRAEASTVATKPQQTAATNNEATLVVEDAFKRAEDLLKETSTVSLKTKETAGAVDKDTLGVEDAFKRAEDLLKKASAVALKAKQIAASYNEETFVVNKSATSARGQIPTKTYKNEGKSKLGKQSKNITSKIAESTDKEKCLTAPPNVMQTTANDNEEAVGESGKRQGGIKTSKAARKSKLVLCAPEEESLEVKETFEAAIVEKTLEAAECSDSKKKHSKAASDVKEIIQADSVAADVIKIVEATKSPDSGEVSSKAASSVKEAIEATKSTDSGKESSKAALSVQEIIEATKSTDSGEESSKAASSVKEVIEAMKSTNSGEESSKAASSVEEAIKATKSTDSGEESSKAASSVKKVIKATKSTDLREESSKAASSVKEVIEATKSTDLREESSKVASSVKEVIEATKSTDSGEESSKAASSVKEVIEATKSTDSGEESSKAASSEKEVIEATKSTNSGKELSKGALSVKEVIEATKSVDSEEESKPAADLIKVLEATKSTNSGKELSKGTSSVKEIIEGTKSVDSEEELSTAADIKETLEAKKSSDSEGESSKAASDVKVIIETKKSAADVKETLEATKSIDSEVESSEAASNVKETIQGKTTQLKTLSTGKLETIEAAGANFNEDTAAIKTAPKPKRKTKLTAEEKSKVKAFCANVMKSGKLESTLELSSLVRPRRITRISRGSDSRAEDAKRNPEESSGQLQHVVEEASLARPGKVETFTKKQPEYGTFSSESSTSSYRRGANATPRSNEMKTNSDAKGATKKTTANRFTFEAPYKRPTDLRLEQILAYIYSEELHAKDHVERFESLIINLTEIIRLMSSKITFPQSTALLRRLAIVKSEARKWDKDSYFKYTAVNIASEEELNSVVYDVLLPLVEKLRECHYEDYIDELSAQSMVSTVEGLIKDEIPFKLERDIFKMWAYSLNGVKKLAERHDMPEGQMLIGNLTCDPISDLMFKVQLQNRKVASKIVPTQETCCLDRAMNFLALTEDGNYTVRVFDDEDEEEEEKEKEKKQGK